MQAAAAGVSAAAAATADPTASGAGTPGAMEPPATPARRTAEAPAASPLVMQGRRVSGAPDCLVCLQPVSNEAPIFLPCAHGPLHWTCFQRTMVSTQNRCPLCRFAINVPDFGPGPGGPPLGPGGPQPGPGGPGGPPGGGCAAGPPGDHAAGVPVPLSLAALKLWPWIILRSLRVMDSARGSTTNW